MALMYHCLISADETIVPPDVPSYLSSQGTLSDRQETVVRTESGHQANRHTESNGKASRTVEQRSGVTVGPGQVLALEEHTGKQQTAREMASGDHYLGLVWSTSE